MHRKVVALRSLEIVTRTCKSCLRDTWWCLYSIPRYFCNVCIKSMSQVSTSQKWKNGYRNLGACVKYCTQAWHAQVAEDMKTAAQNLRYPPGLKYAVAAEKREKARQNMIKTTVRQELLPLRPLNTNAHMCVMYARIIKPNELCRMATVDHAFFFISKHTYACHCIWSLQNHQIACVIRKQFSS